MRETCCCYSYKNGIHPCQCGCHSEETLPPLPEGKSLDDVIKEVWVTKE